MRSKLIRQAYLILGKQSKEEGFTLLEGIVVVGILIVLAAISIPAYQGYIKDAGDARTGYQNKATANSASAADTLKSAKDAAGVP